MRVGVVALVWCVTALIACATPSTSAGGAADLALVAAADLASGDAATADQSAPSVCGNGTCEPGESGASCGADCCDASTSCDVSRGNGGALFCRSMNGGAFAWYSQADTEALCADASQIGKTTWACAARSGFCCSLPGGYVDGTCP